MRPTGYENDRQKGTTLMTISSPHATSLTDGVIVEQSDLGSITRVTADTFPILKGMSAKRVVINPGAMRTPHWHANANELTYCVSGTALVSVLDRTASSPRSRSAPARCSTSTRVAAPHREHRARRGRVHHRFPQRTSRRLQPRCVVRRVHRRVLGNTYDLPASDFAAIRRDTLDRALAARAGDPRFRRRRISTIRTNSLWRASPQPSA